MAGILPLGIPLSSIQPAGRPYIKYLAKTAIRAVLRAVR